jgi:hypothetical protein
MVLSSWNCVVRVAIREGNDVQDRPLDYAHLARTLLWVALAVSWLVMLAYARAAIVELPSEARLETSRMARIPTLGTLAWLVARSGLELAVMLALAWPVRRAWASRIAIAVAALPAWFIATAPLTLTAVEWVHRRWLALAWIALLIALIIAGVARAGRAIMTSSEGEP